MQTTILRGNGEAKRGVAGAGGLGGIGTRADTKQQVRIRRRGAFLGRSPGPSKKRPLKSAVQAGVPEREREKRDARNAW